MGVQQPSLETLARIADQYGFEIPADRLATFRALIGHSLASYGRLDELVEPSLPVSYPRQPGHRPPAEANPLGAWYWKSEIRGAASHPLCAEDAQAWISRGREEADEHREQLLRSNG